MKKIITLVMAITLVFTLAATLGACSPAPTATTAPASVAPETTAPAETAAPSATPAEQKVLKVGLECAYAPFNWTDQEQKNGAVAIDSAPGFAGGYDIEIAKKIAEGLGRKLEIHKIEWTGLVPAAQTGVIDLIIAGMSPTAEKKESVDFTDKYYNSNIVLIVKKGGKFEGAKSLDDLAGAKLTAQLGTTHYDIFLQQIKKADKKAAMDDFGAMRVALATGVIDGYVAEKPEGLMAMAKAPETYFMLDFAAGSGFDTNDDNVSVAIGMKKGQPELAEAINKILSGITPEQRKQMMDDAVKNSLLVK